MLAACAPQTIVQTQIVTQPAEVVEVTKEVPVTQEVTITQIVSPTDEPQTDRVQIYWYIGLGAGSQPAQIQPEKAFVDKFNKSQTEIQLIPIIVDNKYARDNLTAQIAAGNAPDIVGPVGTEGRGRLPRPMARPAAAGDAVQLRHQRHRPGLPRLLQGRRQARRPALRHLPVGAVLQPGPVRRGRPGLPAPEDGRQVHPRRPGGASGTWTRWPRWPSG